MDNLLNLQIVFERLQISGVESEIVPSPDMPGLRGFCFYEPGTVPADFLTICVREYGEEIPVKGSLLLVGDWEKEELQGVSEYIRILSIPHFRLVNILENIFSYYKELEMRLQKTLSMDDSIQEICMIGVEHFHQPVFVHDENYYILACPKVVPGLTVFDYDSQIKTYMQDEKTLLNFRTSAAYQATLTTQGGHLWVSDYSDEKSLYVNIWDEQVYRGRLVVVEENETPGKLREVGHFGDIIRQAIVNNFTYQSIVPDPLKEIFIDALNGIPLSSELLVRKAELVGWKANDMYVCGMAAFIGKGGMSRYLAYSVCHSMQKQVPGIRLFCNNEAIYFIVNLTACGLSMRELRMRMPYVIREYMLQIGVSNIFYHFQDFPIFLKQAEIALFYSLENNRTSWYREFRENALQYWLIHGLGELTKDGMIAAELNLLKEYDEKNGSDLYQTLKVYLMEERNSTLTTQILKIHRSTLPYRLKRIEELTGLNLDDCRVRMYLLMSYAVEGEDLITMYGG